MRVVLIPPFTHSLSKLLELHGLGLDKVSFSFLFSWYALLAPVLCLKPTHRQAARTSNGGGKMSNTAPGGRGGIEDELIGAAMQISELRQESKALRRDLEASQAQVSR